MIRPHYNLQQRLVIRLATLQGACMEFNIAWLKLCRELCREVERIAKRGKFFITYIHC